MVLFDFHSTPFLAYLEFCFDQTDLTYTTDPKMPFTILALDYVVKDISSLPKTKSIVFFMQQEEVDFVNAWGKKSKKSKSYLDQLQNFLARCNLVLVSHEGIATLVRQITKTSIGVVPQELPIINISRARQELYQRYQISKRKKKILILDQHYRYTKWIYILAKKYPKYNFLYLGYVREKDQLKRTREAFEQLPSNVSKIKYFDFDTFSDLCKMSKLIISFDDLIEQFAYLSLILFFQKDFILKKTFYYEQYLEHKVNCYFFDTAEQFYTLVPNLLEDKIKHVGEQGYQLVKQNSFEQVVQKYKFYFQMLEEKQ